MQYCLPSKVKYGLSAAGMLPSATALVHWSVVSATRFWSTRSSSSLPVCQVNRSAFSLVRNDERMNAV